MHPTNEQLAGLANGQLLEDQADDIFAHTEACTACAEAVEQYDQKSDTFIRRIRDKVAPGPYEQEGACEKLVSAIETLADSPT